VMHSTAYKAAANHKGKKVVIIGACTSGKYEAR
jgi:cation diffusion facilitator CzcD-associated flavoprotein CzcO